MIYPSEEEIKNASHYQLAKWWRFLPSPGFAHTDSLNWEELMLFEIKLMDLITVRFKKLGGMTPEISKQLGWNKP